MKRFKFNKKGFVDDVMDLFVLMMAGIMLYFFWTFSIVGAADAKSDNMLKEVAITGDMANYLVEQRAKLYKENLNAQRIDREIKHIKQYGYSPPDDTNEAYDDLTTGVGGS